MIQVITKSQGAMDRSSLLSVNKVTGDVAQAQTIHSLNTRKKSHDGQSMPSQQVSSQPSGARPLLVQPPSTGEARSPWTKKSIPPLRHMVQKGQKAVIDKNAHLNTIQACLGWNTTNPSCDVDVSAFLLNATGKVPGDDWFVFYGQKESPDGSTIFSSEALADRETITIHLDKLKPDIDKIVFVLTIHEALERKLHFGMVQDAYIRLMDMGSQDELVSFKMDEYYTNVISMMIGEVYRHNGAWKFNAVGNGVAKDLSGLCALYGVQVSNETQ